MNKLIVLGIVFILLFTINLTLNNSHASLNPVYEIPITITNSQSIATSNPFQQEIILNESNYKGDIIYNGSFANFEFVYGNGSVIPAWIQQNNSGNLIIWLKLYSIGALSSVTIYLDIFSLTTNLLGSGIGESPLLSKVYGKYDNGAKVFNVYYNFSGTVLDNRISTISGVNLVQNNSLSISLTTTTNPTFYILTSSFVSSPFVMETYETYYGVSTTTNNNEQYGLVIDSNTSISENTGGLPGGTNYAGRILNNAGESPQILEGSTSLKNEALNFQSQYTTIDSFIQNSTGVTIDFDNTSLYASTTALTSGYIGFYAFSKVANEVLAKIYWLRVRAYPPNNVMPSVSFGSLTVIKYHKYSISFKESGLASGIEWSVRLNNSTSVLYFNSTNDYANFTNLVNGSYYFKISVLNNWYSISPSTGKITINGANVTENITFTKLYEVTFTESGLASGIEWKVTFYQSTKTVQGSSVSFSGYSNGSYTFAIQVLNNWYSINPSSGSITINGANVTENIIFIQRFSLEFHESGLPSNTLWNITINGIKYGTTVNSFILTENMGNYTFSIQNISNYKVFPQSGIVYLNKNTTVNITFSLNKTYSAIFIEYGLSNGVEWLVEMDNSIIASTSNKIIFSGLGNGSYYFKIKVLNNWYSINPSNGNITINGANVTENISFSQLYSITFNANGLASGIEWKVTLNSVNLTSTSNSIVFSSLTNGNYHYQVFIFNKWYSINPENGNITINNANITQNVTFTKLYTITFVESGLPSGMAWSLYLNSNYYFNNSNEIIISYLSEGNYSFSIVSIQGYNITPISGNIYLNQNVTENIKFSFTYLISLGNSGSYNITYTDLKYNTQYFSFIIDDTFLIFFVMIIFIIFLVFMGIASVRGRK